MPDYSRRNIEFHKMQGCGNDFILIDNRALAVPTDDMPALAKALCRRTLGIGADGLIFLESLSEPGVDYRWHFYNADGSRGEMCGNASRCAARLALELGLAGLAQTFRSDAGKIKAEVYPEGDQVKVRLTAPSGLKIGLSFEIQGRVFEAHFVNTGVPHCVLLVDALDEVDVAGLGRAIRFHHIFAPAGSNVNFVQVIDRGNIAMRTYERGVEAETMACGTGAAASALVCQALGLTGDSVGARTSGGERLVLDLKDGQVFLTGAAVKVFCGRLCPGALL